MTLPDLDRPLVVTERLELWLPREDDIADMLAIVADPHTHRYLAPMGTTGSHLSRILRNTGSWVIYGYGLCAVKFIGDDRPIGNCAIFHSHRDLGADFDGWPEAGWIIGARHEGKGIASEAMQGLLEWFDAAHGREIVCLIEPGNAASLRLAEKLGFAPMREAILSDGDAALLLQRPAASGQ